MSTVLTNAHYRRIENTRAGRACGIFCDVEEDGRTWTMTCENLDPNQTVMVVRSEPDGPHFESLDMVELKPLEKKSVNFKVDNDENFFYAMVLEDDNQYRTMEGKMDDNTLPNYTGKGDIHDGDFHFVWRVIGRSTYVDHHTISVLLTW